MAWFSVAISVIGVATSLSAAKQARKAGRQSEELGRMNAVFIGQETAEESRRLVFEQQQIAGRSRSVIAASGFKSGAKTIGASSRAYLLRLKDVQQKELAWLQKSGRSRANIAKAGGISEAQRLKSQATGLYGQAISTGLQGYSAFQNR